MPFIGIISDSKSEKSIKNILSNKLEKDSNIIIINDKSIENLKNIKFETILITNNSKIFEKYQEILKQMIFNTKFLIMNADIAINLELYQDNILRVITFGFNPKATVTASSVEEGILLCVQRTIEDKNANKIEQQEIKIKFDENTEISVNNLIGIATVVLLYGKLAK